MANNNQNNKIVVKKQIHKEVIMLKVLTIFVIALVPIAIMMLDLANQLTSLKNKSLASKTNINKPADQFNFEAPLPQGQVGDLSNVPKEEIDTLFNNLKTK